MYKILIDTNIYIDEKYDFDNENFNYLRRLASNNLIKLLISEIVYNETIKYIMKDITILEINMKKIYNIGQIRDKNNEALPKRMLSRIMLENTKEFAPVFNINFEKLKSECVNNFKKLINDLNGEKIGVDDVDLSEILDDYFNNKPPFERNKNKKSEFPDAIIAKSIQNLKNDNLIVLSNDEGFLNSIDIRDEMKFNKIDKMIKFFANKYQPKNYKLVIEKFMNKIDEYDEIVLEKIDETSINVDGLSYGEEGELFGYDYDEFTITDKSILEYEYDDSYLEKIDDKKYSITVYPKISIELNCWTFDESNSIWDSEEKDYIYKKYLIIKERHIVNPIYKLFFSLNNEDDFADVRVSLINPINLNYFTLDGKREIIDSNGIWEDV